jgi:hypothetical protein
LEPEDGGFELGGVVELGFVELPGFVVVSGVELFGGVVGDADDPGAVLGAVVPWDEPVGEVRTLPSGFTHGVVAPAEAPAEAEGFDGFEGVPACACPADGVALPLTPEQG